MPMELHRLLNDFLFRKMFHQFWSPLFVSEALMAARQSSKLERAGSIPVAHFYVAVAQWPEQPSRKRQVMSSNLIGGF